jgi:transcriptional repressor NF-X1
VSPATLAAEASSAATPAEPLPEALEGGAGEGGCEGGEGFAASPAPAAAAFLLLPPSKWPPPLPLAGLSAYPSSVVGALVRFSRACGRKLSCGRHACKRVCCALAGGDDPGGAGEMKLCTLEVAEGVRLRLTGGGGGGGGAPEANPEHQGPRHMCLRTCGRPLSCGAHACDLNCHSGPCPPCTHVARVPLRCPCGFTGLLPPIRCGTKLPSCTQTCRAPRRCGHPHPQWHYCHEGACPPCAALVERACAGGHEVKRVPCATPEVVCGHACGRRLPCGAHRCARLCHGGPCAGGAADAAAAGAAAEAAAATAR